MHLRKIKSSKAKFRKLALFMALGLSLSMMAGDTVSAATVITETDNAVTVAAAGVYANWDGVTNVAQFSGPDGKLLYAINSDNYVTIYKTSGGKPTADTVILQKQHPIFGTVLCDSEGNYYLVTGESNNGDDTNVETIFISKYDSAGNHVATTGDNGSSSLAYYYGETFYTKYPFEAGNCDAAISGKILSVHYARKMYSGHQSNSVFSVNIDDMSKVNTGVFYESHSFAQRVVPTSEGFVYMSEGDCFERSFMAYRIKMSGNTCTYSSEEPTFDFWVKDGAYDEYNMYVVNENFAHMGGLAALPNGKVAFAAQSVQSLNSNASSESQEIFLQIFDPYQSLKSPDAYVTTGERSGLAGNNGRTSVTNYGVKWLTSYGSSAKVANVQIAATDGNEIVVLYEYSEGNSYKGVYYMVLDQNGNVTCPATLFDAGARLNPCEMPVYSEGKIRWVGNKYGDSSKKIYIYSLGISDELEVAFSHTCTVGNDLSLNYYIESAPLAGYENIRLVVEKKKYGTDDTYTIQTKTISTYSIGNTGTNSAEEYKFTYRGLYAYEMGDELKAKIVAEKDGVTYESNVDTYSIKTYAINNIKKPAVADKLKRLLVDMLNYGAQAQIYFNYNKANLVNAELTDAMLAYGTTGNPTLTSYKETVETAGATASFKGHTLITGSNIELKYYMGFDDGVNMDNVTMRMSYTAIDGTPHDLVIPASQFSYDQDAKEYSCKIATVATKDFSCKITAGIYEGDKLISPTDLYSIGSYINNQLGKPDVSDDIKALLAAMGRYGVSAQEYFKN